MVDPATVKMVTDLISQVGFPIVVAGYLLFRMERKLSRLEKEFTELKTEVLVLLGGKRE